MSYTIFVFGPPGCGKSTFTKNLQEWSPKHRFIPINLDPSQKTDYPIDITELITTEEIMEETGLGPNYSIFEALKHFHDEIDLEDENYIVDCPGQIELFIHCEEMKKIVDKFTQTTKCIIVYLLDGQNTLDIRKYLGSCLCAMMCMVRFNLPVINLITKVDIYDIDDVFLSPDERLLELCNNKFCEKVLDILSDNLITFMKLDWDEDTVDNILYQIDTSMQYYDDLEPKESFK